MQGGALVVLPGTSSIRTPLVNHLGLQWVTSRPPSSAGVIPSSVSPSPQRCLEEKQEPEPPCPSHKALLLPPVCLQRPSWLAFRSRSFPLWLTSPHSHGCPSAGAQWLENFAWCQVLLRCLAVLWDVLALHPDFSNILLCGFLCSTQDILQKAPYKLTQ